ncbi:hypothetical protein OG897_32470 [Streptomyces sp. NBC_00237]|uniref:hypothetical protein n=1 Tax=Streptomyces sp. NBC_00237 TaxID=2975687 RepID=UPI00225056D3|nr:hypothetical protein [Streptomyces sp. NBC_00237]MCX5206112.1 hypothetical protein [Streptomyces sp. NBC_00237]
MRPHGKPGLPIQRIGDFAAAGTAGQLAGVDRSLAHLVDQLRGLITMAPGDRAS